MRILIDQNLPRSLANRLALAGHDAAHTPDEGLERATDRRVAQRPSMFAKPFRLHLDEIEEPYWADEAVPEWEASGKKSKSADELWDELGV